MAVISGRPLAYLHAHLAEAGHAQLVGLYGLDRSAADPNDSAVEEWRAAIEAAARRAESVAPLGVMIERKGLAVTLHYRRAPEHAGWAHNFARVEAEDSGLVLHPGKMSVELRPPVATDKGTVVAELGAGLTAVMFIGDDLGDLPAFATLSRIGEETGAKTLAVAVRGGAETPQALLDAADLTVDGPSGVLNLLDVLGEGLTASG